MSNSAKPWMRASGGQKPACCSGGNVGTAGRTDPTTTSTVTNSRSNPNPPMPYADTLPVVGGGGPSYGPYGSAVSPYSAIGGLGGYGSSYGPSYGSSYGGYGSGVGVGGGYGSYGGYGGYPPPGVGVGVGGGLPYGGSAAGFGPPGRGPPGRPGLVERLLLATSSAGELSRLLEHVFQTVHFSVGSLSDLHARLGGLEGALEALAAPLFGLYNFLGPLLGLAPLKDLPPRIPAAEGRLAREFGESRRGTAAPARPASLLSTMGRTAASVGLLYLALLAIRAIHTRLGSSSSRRRIT